MPYRTVAKKEEERFYLDRFRELVEGFPEGQIEETEEPDFVIHSEPRLGIEITKLFWEPDPGRVPRQAIHSARELVAIRAQERHIAAGLPACHVSVHFVQRDIGKAQVDALADAVFEIVRDNLPPPNQMRRIPPNFWTHEYLPEQLAAIHIYHHGIDAESFYSAPQGGFVPDLDPVRDIQERVLDSKNVRVSEYLRKCDRVWLVINIGFGDLAGQFDLPKDLPNHVFNSRFDRSYLLHQHARQCVQLRTVA